ncbi:MAG TPA: sigma-54 dependent transcriptional regulator [Labilithrix sp.]|nr:sigma-54 dependent transcriptional regulator [Labilithrix sp.]
MDTVLVVDDQLAVRTALSMMFDVHGIRVEAVATPQAALERVRAGGIAVVIQDMNFTRDTTSGDEGVELFRAIRQADASMPVVLVTAWTSLQAAVMLVKEGANDYLQKPWDDTKLVALVSTLLRIRRLEAENARLARESNEARDVLAESFDLCGLVYRSRPMHELVSIAVNVARSNAPVLVTGPNGSGKEKIAEIVQRNSPRRNAPFIRVNAGALPEALMEAELFGAEAGAFTGAVKTRIGRFEAADGGTLFLDEIGNLSLVGQMKLLRVLQTGEYQRLGSTVTRKADVRLVSATNCNLEEAIVQKTFREDLYFRLNVVELAVPPLGERTDDVLPIAEELLRQHPSEVPLVLDEAARAALVAYPWPGNVRELQNRIQRALIVARGGVITREALGLEAAAPPARDASDERDLDRGALEAAIARADGNVSRAAAELGLSRQALYRRLDRLGIVIERRTRST